MKPRNDTGSIVGLPELGGELRRIVGRQFREHTPFNEFTSFEVWIWEKISQHVYTEATNSAFPREGGNVTEYASGIAFGTAAGWLDTNRFGTRNFLLKAERDLQHGQAAPRY